MKKLLIMLFAMSLLCGCGNQNSVTNLGVSSYTPSFLWTNDSTEFITKTFYTNWSAGAIQRGHSATFKFDFFDSNGSVPANAVAVYLDNTLVQNGQITIKADTTTQRVIKICPKPGTAEGDYSCNITVTSNNIQAQHISSQTPTVVFKYVEKMNDLKCGLMWVGIVLVVGLVLWKTILIRLWCPTFKSNCKWLIETPEGNVKSLNLGGKRMGILTQSKKEQGAIDKFFTGEILYVRDVCFTQDISLTPMSNRKDVLIACPPELGYPDDRILQQFGSTEIKKNDGGVIYIHP